MAFASISTSMASPFQQMQREASQALYGMGLTGEMDISEIRRKMMEMQRFGNQARGVFGGSMFRPPTQSMSFSDSMMGSSPSMPYSSTMMGRGLNSSLGSGMSQSGLPFSSSSWSSMGNAPRFPYSGMMGSY